MRVLDLFCGAGGSARGVHPGVYYGYMPGETYRRVKQDLVCTECGAGTRIRFADMAHTIDCKSTKGFGALTPRQQQIAMLIARGDLTIKEMAFELSISFKTAEQHRDGLFRRLGIHTGVQLVHLLYEMGILPLAKGAVEPIRPEPKIKFGKF